MTGAEQTTVIEFEIDGLTDSVEILLDEWGVPHIYAAGSEDLYVAQGFNAARDRLFQIDLWRRRGLGLLAEVFGPACVAQDRARRLFLYRGDMETEWAAYGPGAQTIAEAFVRGINAYVELTAADPALLPEEFGLLGYRPARWAAEDIARIRSHGLYQNVLQEVTRARTLAQYGAAVEDLRRIREPSVDLVVPDGLDPASIPENVLSVYQLACSPALLSDDSGSAPGQPTGQGSNNWVISGARTATGRPLLANDPHRSVSLPGLRYLAHLVTPELDVIGAGEPALPGVSIGHNERIAFGLTIFSIDQEDLYVYQFRADESGGPGQYRYEDGWEAVVRVSQTVPVAGGADAPVTLDYTRHGPIVHIAGDRAYAVRAAWLEPGMAPYLGSVDYMGAQNWDEFTGAMRRWGSPGENQVYADVDGNIGWAPAGRVPVRPNWNGLLPVPGDGRYEWSGHHDAQLLPRVFNPAAGWFSTANEMNLPPDYPNDDRTVGYDWYAPFRQQRIAEVLGAEEAMTVADCVRLQTDYLSVPARRIVEFLLSTPADLTADAAEPLAMLREWDAREATDSAAAALYEIFYRRHLRPAYVQELLRSKVAAPELAAATRVILPEQEDTGDARLDLLLIADPDRFLGPGGTEKLQRLAMRALATAYRELVERLGADRDGWRWGDLHHAYLEHPALPLLGPQPPDWATLGPLPRGGSGDTVGATTYLPNFRQSVGATFRIVVDVGDWDNSVAMNSPGQSGRPSDPHYQDLFRPWAADESFPLLYSRAAVEAHTSRRYLLVPRDSAR